jgi:hypothetical protein
MNILLVEDRRQRQEQFLDKTKIVISKYSFVDNKIGESYQKFRDEILKDHLLLEKYDVIISHRSAFDKDNSKIMDIIENYCTKNNKALILFSGGIYTSFYSEEPFEKLSLNSKTLYSQNLELFLENIENNTKINLLLLAFGEHWEVNLLLNVLEKTNLFILKFKNLDDDDKSYDNFNDETDIEIIKNKIDITNIINKEELTIEDLEVLKNKMLAYINEKLEIYNV